EKGCGVRRVRHAGIEDGERHRDRRWREDGLVQGHRGKHSRDQSAARRSVVGIAVDPTAGGAAERLARAAPSFAASSTHTTEHPLTATPGPRGLAGVVAARTRLSHVEGQAGELIIGGYELKELAGRVSFEEAAHLLWRG